MAPPKSPIKPAPRKAANASNNIAKVSVPKAFSPKPYKAPTMKKGK